MDDADGLQGDCYEIDVADLVVFGSGQIYRKVRKSESEKPAKK
jgi:hypothetical protein